MMMMIIINIIIPTAATTTVKLPVCLLSTRACGGVEPLLY